MEAPSEPGASLLSLSGDGFFATLADNVPIIVFTTAPDGTIEWYNGRWFEYTGFTPEQTYVGFGYRDAVHPDDRQRLIDCGRNARASGMSGCSEARYRRRDGVYRWHRVTAIPSRNQYGEIVRWLGTVVDIEESYASDRALQALSDGTGLLVWSIAPDGTNLQYHGPQRHSLDLIHPDDRADTLRARDESLRSGNIFNYVLRMATGPGGAYRWQRTTMVPVREDDGTITRWYGVTMDIHDELVARDSSGPDVEAKVRRDVTRHTPALLFITDPMGEVTFVNDRWVHVTGKRASDLLGDGIRALMHPSDFARAFDAWQQRNVDGEELVMQYRLLCADGRYRWIETRSLPELDADGRVTRWIGVGLDVDQHRRTIAALDFIIDASAKIAEGTDEHDVLRRLAEATLEDVADICAIDLLDGSGAGTRIVVAAPNVDSRPADILASFDPPRPHPTHPVSLALFEGRSSYLPYLDRAYIEDTIMEDRREAWVAVGAHSLIVVPIKAAGTIFGAIFMVRNVIQSAFEPSDFRMIEEIASRAALAIVNIRLTEALRRESENKLSQYRRIADFSPQTMWTADAQGNVEWLNRRWYEYTGLTPDESLGTGALKAAALTGDEYTFWDHVQQSDEPFETERLIRRHDGSSRWHLVRAVPERDEHGAIVRWYGMNVDIHESRRAARTMRVFADLGEVLAETIGLQETLDRAMEVIVPEYADWSYIALADEDRELRIRAVYDAVPKRAAALRTLVGKTFLRPTAVGGSALSFSRRIPHLIPDMVQAHATQNILPAAHRVFNSIGFTSVLTLPLIVNGVARGTLVLGMSSVDRTFNEEELPFYQELARRISPAIANAELFERERRVARTFQEASLPSSLPKLPGYEFSAVYEAGRAEALVGGDWYDAFGLVDGRIVLSIGDVAGSGLRAAVIMSNVRQAIRGVAHVHADPSLILEAADGIVRSQHPDTFVTAFVGVLDPVTNTLTYQCAGHPQPLVVLPGDGTIQLECGGLPLGLRTREEPPNQQVELPNGALLVLYTDGLIEATRSLDEGNARVLEALAKGSVRDAASPAAALHDDVLVEGSKDDVAILTVRIGAPPAGVTYRIASAWDRERVREARNSILGELRRHGMTSDAVTIAELIIVELTGNLARYAPGESTLSLVWNDGVPVLHILDSGPGYSFAAKLPQDVMSESGRGLFLVAALANNLVVTPRVGGGSHTMVAFNI